VGANPQARDRVVAPSGPTPHANENIDRTITSGAAKRRVLACLGKPISLEHRLFAMDSSLVFTGGFDGIERSRSQPSSPASLGSVPICLKRQQPPNPATRPFSAIFASAGLEFRCQDTTLAVVVVLGAGCAWLAQVRRVRGGGYCRGGRLSGRSRSRRGYQHDR
jgi:hypothetical protein